MTRPKPMTILMAEDDPDDCLLVGKAFAAAKLRNDLRIVRDGEELLDYLHQRNAYAAPGAAPRPGIILLDLNMPRMNGHEALAVIKANPALKEIPVIVLTTSKAHEDILKTYENGGNSFIRKPVTFKGLVDVLKTIELYWFQIAETPEGSAAR